jgi:hypothetical protein
VVRAALVVSVASGTGPCTSGFLGAVPTAAPATANGGRAGEQRESERADGVAAGAAALVRNALVVSAWRRGEYAGIDDTGCRARNTDDAG